jgi:hypothetical protein
LAAIFCLLSSSTYAIFLARKRGFALIPSTGRADVASIDTPLTTPHLPQKGVDMAVSKSTRRSPLSTRQPVLALFRKSKIEPHRRHEWLDATPHLEDEGPITIRFPVYRHLHALNLHAQSAINALEEIGKSLDRQEDMEYYQANILYMRSLATGDVLDHMHGVEDTESWIFDILRREEERKLVAPDDVYIDVRRREAERLAQGMPPKIKFLEENPRDRPLGGILPPIKGERQKKTAIAKENKAARSATASSSKPKEKNQQKKGGS